MIEVYVLLSFNFYLKLMNIDAYLSTLEKLKIIPEKDVKMICEKVTLYPFRPKKFSLPNPIWSMYVHLSPSVETPTDNFLIYFRFSKFAENCL